MHSVNLEKINLGSHKLTLKIRFVRNEDFYFDIDYGEFC